MIVPAPSVNEMPASPAYRLIEPNTKDLPQIIAAFARGWSPNNLRDVSRECYEKATHAPEAFLAEERGEDMSPIAMPDGSLQERLPGFARWIWDGALCGRIGFRWRPPDESLPPYCLGHVGYAVVPWKRGAGAATAALGLLKPLLAFTRLKWIDLTTDAANAASIRVIEKNGGRHVGEVTAPFAPNEPKRLYRIMLENG